MPKGWEKLKKDPQESVENKRWSIEQIKYFLDSASDEIGGAETYFLAKLRNHTLSLRNLRTIFLSVISLALAIVLGIREPVNLSMVNFIQILIILLFISAGGMLVIEVIKSRLSVHILNVEYGFKAIPFRINILKGFISNASFDLDRITESDLRGYGKFCMIYYYYRRELVDAINAAAKSASLLKFKSEMEEQSKLTQVVMHMGYEMFGKFQNDLLKNGLLLSFFNTPFDTAYLNEFRTWTEVRKSSSDSSPRS